MVLTGSRLARSFSPLLLLLLSVVEIVAIRRGTHGSFTYSLDDPYIHLALAENIARGTYGVNLGEVSAPASSLLWPFLLAPLACTWFAEFVPLCINLCASALTLDLVFRFLRVLFAARSAQACWLVTLATCVFLLSTNMLGLAFTGMEHSLQVLGVVALLYSAQLELRERRLSAWASLLLAVLPMLRYESLVLTAPISLYFASRGYLRRALSANLVASAALIVFSCALRAHGLGWLPTSVEAKSNLAIPVLQRASDIVRKSWDDPHVALFFLLLLAFLLLACVLRSAPMRAMALVLASATAGHLYIGNFGWFDRYEIYLFSAQVLGLAWLLAEPVRALGRGQALRVALLSLLALLFLSGSYIARALQTPAAARNMYEQQLQMHRFAVAYGRPVAVNDLGLVSFRNDAYVLDLTGLASREALLASRREDPRVWKQRLVRKHNVELAMIYDPGPEGLPRDFQALGTLTMAGPLVTAADRQVQFFATRAAAAATLRALLARFRETLPEGVRFDPVSEPSAAVTTWTER